LGANAATRLRQGSGVAGDLSLWWQAWRLQCAKLQPIRLPLQFRREIGYDFVMWWQACRLRT